MNKNNFLASDGLFQPAKSIKSLTKKCPIQWNTKQIINKVEGMTNTAYSSEVQNNYKHLCLHAHIGLSFFLIHRKIIMHFGHAS
jgi:hypothetical protein